MEPSDFVGPIDTEACISGAFGSCLSFPVLRSVQIMGFTRLVLSKDSTEPSYLMRAGGFER